MAASSSIMTSPTTTFNGLRSQISFTPLTKTKSLGDSGWLH
ncbi:hypothetical protein LINPERHAP1_LOCUS38052 [Linum perenne]